MKKNVLTHVVVGASMMVGVFAVNAACKAGIKLYKNRVQEKATDEIGEVIEEA